MLDDQSYGDLAVAERPDLSPTGLEEFGAATSEVDELEEDEFDLDVRVLVTLAPVGQTDCPTDDGCGNTCGGNASSCNSSMNALS